MGTRLLIYIGMLIVGILIGYKEISHKKFLEKINYLQLGALILLLFVMGIRIGSDEKVINSIGEIGIKACIISISSILFSILTVFIYRKCMKLNKKGE